MRSLLLLGVIGLFTVTVLAGCASHSEGLLPGPAHETAGLTLNVMPETFLGGAEVGELTLDVSDLGDSLMVDIVATGATNLKALYFALDYDKTSLRPMTVDTAGLLGDSDELLSLQVFKERGVVHYGQVLTHPDLRVGFNGDGVLATVLFSKESALNTRLVSTAPNRDLSAQIVDPDLTTNLSWWYANQGDYDQNSEVNLADLTQIAIHFMQAGPWPIGHERVVIDGDGNLEINSADIAQIAINFQNSAWEFRIYSSANAADYPDGGTPVTILGEAAILQSDGVAGPDRRKNYSVAIADIDGYAAANWYWVRPADGAGGGADVGIVSNLVGGGDVLRPIITLTNPPGTGDGSVGTPWVADILTDYTFTLTDPTDGDVTNDAVNTLYVVNDGAAGGIDTADATLNIEDAYTGTFIVSATYKGVPSDNVIYMMIEDGPPSGLFIMPDPADTDWDTDVTGTGADASNPYVLGISGGFNSDHATDYGMAANTQADGLGDVIPNGDLTWFAFPPFVVEWTGVGTGIFNTNMFTSEYIYAQDSETNNSNNVYVVHQSLPDS